LLGGLLLGFTSRLNDSKTLTELIELTEILSVSNLSARGIIILDLSISFFYLVKEKCFAGTPINVRPSFRDAFSRPSTGGLTCLSRMAS
jgi:hypothetical protein